MGGNESAIADRKHGSDGGSGAPGKGLRRPGRRGGSRGGSGSHGSGSHHRILKEDQFSGIAVIQLTSVST
jgi:hypothetical protein